MEAVNGAGEEAAKVLPGFRFHPTDQELIGFYLRRKVERRLPLRVDLIKQVDIYKHDPWDLPRMIGGAGAGEKEWYFFCRRGRKYKNSARPNRVTASGFWKATGIDRPVHAAGGGAGQGCIGLKKSLVYYRGSAGRGTKTDWMMHEFRLPPAPAGGGGGLVPDSEAETWTVCRIFKRDISLSRRPPPDRHGHHHHQLLPGSIGRITWSEGPNQQSPACRSTSSDAESVDRSLVAFLDGETESNTAAAAAAGGACGNLRPPPWCTGAQLHGRRSAAADRPNPFGFYAGVLASEDGGSWDELGRLVEESAEDPPWLDAGAPRSAGC